MNDLATLADRVLPEGVPADARSQLLAAIRQCAYIDGGEERIISPSGGRQIWMLDLRQVFLRPELLLAIANAFWDRFAGQLPFQLAGMEVAAIPLLTALLTTGHGRGLDVSGVILRKERKTTGLGKSIEGNLTGHPVVLVDDVLNSGASMEKARVLLTEAGAKIGQAFVVVDYLHRDGVGWRKQHGIPVASLFTLADFGLAHARSAPTIDRGYQFLWRYASNGAYPFYVVPKSTPLLAGNRLFMGTDSGTMVAVDTTNGKEVWSFKAKGAFERKGIWSSPCLHDGRLYFGAYNGMVYCLDAATGVEIWSRPSCEWIGSSPCVVAKHGLLVIGLEYERPRQKGSVIALSLETGELVWEQWLKEYQHGSGAYWAQGDLVVFGTNDHTVVGYQAATGEMVWECKTPRSIKYAPAIDEERGLVAAASFGGTIYILDVATGQLRMELPTDNTCYTTPLFHGNRLYCGSGDRHFYIVDLDEMKLIKRLDAGARVYSSPRVIAGNVVFGTNGGRIYEIDAQDLAIRGTLQLPDAVTNAIATSPDGSFLYAATYMNEIYAFRRSSASALRRSSDMNASRPVA